MYNVYGFGKRIMAYRKAAGLTQEELAERLHITPQAVSKWENEVSFPEITMLPRLAEALGTSIEMLFGREVRENGGESEAAFPEFLGPDLKLVHIYQNVACYSEKEVERIEGTVVTFADGSQANLAELKIVNQGSGEIRFSFGGEKYYQEDMDQSLTEKEEFFDGIHSLEISVTNAQYFVTQASTAQTRVFAQGSPLFINRFNIRNEGGRLVINERENHGMDVHFNQGNRVEIALGCERGENISLAVNGVGSADILVPFKRGKLSVNGSGDIEADEFDVVECDVNGSGDISCSSAEDAALTVNGSGDITIERVNKNARAVIRGSGDIIIESGTVNHLSVQILGAGDVDAEDVTARTAEIRVSGSGEITIGRVIEKSEETHSRHSAITILRRG